MDTLHIRFLRYSAFYSPLLLTMGGGHLRAEGLEATFDVVTPERTIADGIARGEVQVAQSAPFVSFAPCLRGESLPFRHFALMNSHDGFFVAGRASEGPFDWSDLEGRTVLVDHFAQPLVMFRRALHLRGLDERAVRIIDAGDVGAMERAFREGRAEFVHLQGPVPQQLEVEGVGIVGPSVGEAVGPVAFSSLCASPDWLATDQARAFTRAFHRGMEQAQQASASDVAHLVAPFLPGVDRVALVRTIEAYQRLGTWRHDRTIPRDLYEQTVDIFVWGGVIAARPPYEAVVAARPG